jgi:hypothetical protein
MLSEEGRKRLTEYMGEWWHTLVFFFDNGYVKCSCGEKFRCPDEGTFHVEVSNDRTFLTSQDCLDLFDKLCKKGDLWRFLRFAESYNPHTFDKLYNDANSGFIAWLFSTTPDGYRRLIVLCDEWLKGKE